MFEKNGIYEYDHGGNSMDKDDPLCITFITGNQHKVKEAQGIFHQFNIQVEHIDLGYPEIQGELIDVWLAV